MNTTGQNTTGAVDIQAVASRIKLVELSRSIWAPQAVNREASREVNAKNGTDDEATVLVRFCKHGALDRIKTLKNRLYDDHKRMTLPSVTDGLRIINPAREHAHHDMVRDAQAALAGLVDEFLLDYPAIQAQAPVKLNGLYDASCWPDVSLMRDRFSFRVRYLDCLTTGAWSDWLSESASAAQADLRDRVVNALRKMSDYCRNGKKLYDTLFDGFKSLVDDIPYMDVMQSTELKQELDNMRALAKYDKEDATSCAETRNMIASKADSILASFGEFSL